MYLRPAAGPWHAVEVEPHLGAGFGAATPSESMRDAHLAVPDPLVAVHACLDLVAGVPGRVVRRRLRAAVDGEVHPLALRRDLEFLVLLDVLEVGADERLRHVPVPELVGVGGGHGIRLHVQLLVGGDEQEVEVLVRPARADLGAVARAPACPNRSFSANTPSTPFQAAAPGSAVSAKSEPRAMAHEHAGAPRGRRPTPRRPDGARPSTSSIAVRSTSEVALALNRSSSARCWPRLRPAGRGRTPRAPPARGHPHVHGQRVRHRRLRRRRRRAAAHRSRRPSTRWTASTG